MTTWLILLALFAHLTIGWEWGWPAWQAIQKDQRLLTRTRREIRNLEARLADLAPLEERGGTAFETYRAAQALDPSGRLQRLASSLTEWGDLAEVEITSLRSLENKDTRLALQVEVRGPSAAVVRWLGLVERSKPPVHINSVTLKRVATRVEASVNLESPPALHFDPPSSLSKVSWKIDPFRKDP